MTRRFEITRVVGAHQYGDNGATFVLDSDEGEIAVELDAAGVMTLLGLALQNSAGTFEHDGMQMGQLNGQPTIGFRFGPDRWLSILLGPNDLEVLRTALRPRVPSAGSEPRH